MSERIVDEQFVNELEQFIEELLQHRSDDSADIPQEVLDKYHKGHVDPYNFFDWFSKNPKSRKQLEAILALVEKSGQAQNESVQKLARLVARVYVKTGESMAQLRDDLGQALPTGIQNNSSPAPTVYGLDPASPEFPRHAAAMKQLADDNYSHFLMDIQRLEQRQESLEAETGDTLRQLRRENALLRQLALQSLGDNQCSDGYPDSVATEEISFENRVERYKALLGGNSSIAVFNQNALVSAENESEAVIAIGAFDTDAACTAFTGTVNSGCTKLIVETRDDLPGSSQWCQYWLQENGWKVIEIKHFADSWQEAALKPVQADQPLPGAINSIIDQINDTIARINSRIYTSGFTVYLAERR